MPFGDGSERLEAMDRSTICLPLPGTQNVLHRGDHGFKQEIERLYPAAEAVALERLIDLKKATASLSPDDYFVALTEGLSILLGADLSFVIKRILVDEQDAAVEMPPHGTEGSCMMAAAFHYCANDGAKTNIRGHKFHAWGCPCAYMRHDKVFVIPEDLNNFITNNPNQLPVPAEAYIAVPLFAEGKCFAHFGAMWSKECAAKRQLSWSFIEALLHSLEDQVVTRLIEGANFVRPVVNNRESSRVVPHGVISVAQSLRPYAGSLSHEIRTPMTSIVGMLDVMYATVQDAIESQVDPSMRKVFENLMENIEVVQDSSRRAIEAADNVVHAYDMDMSVPDVDPVLTSEDPNDAVSSAQTEKRPEILVAGSNLPLARPNKRKRDEAFSRQGSGTFQNKVPRVEGAPTSATYSADAVETITPERNSNAEPYAVQGAEPENRFTREVEMLFPPPTSRSMRLITPGIRHANLRELLQYVIHEGLKVGGRPDTVFAQETDHGETIEVRSRGSDGSASSKTIEWAIDPNVPKTMFVDEKDLSKLVSCVFLNAIKFTDNVDGRIGIGVSMSSRARYISIRISDNGPGIPSGFLPRLFKPFSQQNPSLTRQSEGLGLGLMVAKGIARKLGGDLKCTRATTEGLHHGSEFEIKVPVTAGDTISRPVSPFGSPLPRRAILSTVDTPHTPDSPPSGPKSLGRSASPGVLSAALNEAVNERPASCQTCADIIASCVENTSRERSPRSLDPKQSSRPPKTVSIVASSAADHTSTTTSPVTEGESTTTATKEKYRPRKSVGGNPQIDRNLAARYPLTILVVEDNKINRKLLVSMLVKLGYRNILEAHDGTEAVRQMSVPRSAAQSVDVILMDLWMPLMDGYEATEKILSVAEGPARKPTVLAVTADVTDGALERAAQVGMTGFMTKPYKMADLQRLITEYCAGARPVAAAA